MSQYRLDRRAFLQGLGGAMLALPGLQTLAGALPLDFISAERIGPDLRLLARLAGRGHF